MTDLHFSMSARGTKKLRNSEIRTVNLALCEHLLWQSLPVHGQNFPVCLILHVFQLHRTQFCFNNYGFYNTIGNDRNG